MNETRILGLGNYELSNNVKTGRNRIKFVQEVELFTYEKTTHTSILNTDFI